MSTGTRALISSSQHSGLLTARQTQTRQCVAFILVPAYHKGPRQDLITALNDGTFVTEGDRYLTHGLHYVNDDPVINQLARENITQHSRQIRLR